jgi:hypothetical protein
LTTPETTMPAARSRIDWIQSISYWFFTLTIAFEMVAGSMWDLLQIEYARGVLTDLGYPHYLLLILGFWKLPCAVVVLVPRFPRLKEWAYAGAFFNYSGACASHIFVGDGPGKWVGPLIFAGITLASWALRPPERRLTQASAATRPSAVAWIVPLVIVIVFLIFALLTLPKGFGFIRG